MENFKKEEAKKFGVSTREREEIKNKKHFVVSCSSYTLRDYCSRLKKNCFIDYKILNNSLSLLPSILHEWNVVNRARA